MSEDAKTLHTVDERAPTREDVFKQFLMQLRIPFVKSVAEGFFENTRQIESLVQMPLVLFSFLEVDDHLFERFRVSVQEHWSRGMDYMTFLQEHD